MIDFELWWNSAAADAYRARYPDLCGEDVREVWNAAIHAAQAPQDGAEAMRWLNEIETVQGGSNGPTIKLRAAISALIA